MKQAKLPKIDLESPNFFYQKISPGENIKAFKNCYTCFFASTFIIRGEAVHKCRRVLFDDQLNKIENTSEIEAPEIPDKSERTGCAGWHAAPYVLVAENVQLELF